jgi:hypothetical protein
MVEILEMEIGDLRAKQNSCNDLAELTENYLSITASVPSLGVTERFIRCEAHLSREFDRALSQLESLQRFRRGQPVRPSIKIERQSSGGRKCIKSVRANNKRAKSQHGPKQET